MLHTVELLKVIHRQTYKTVHILLLLLFKYYSEMLYIRIVPAGSEVVLKDM